ncbi:hypothetical protein GQX74_014479 [Glossina fuscipes]|nr:hypothetical protein GQX74_014479 [Glossina fuscipes]
MQKLPRIHAKEKVLLDETPFGIFAIKHNSRPTQGKPIFSLHGRERNMFRNMFFSISILINSLDLHGRRDRINRYWRQAICVFIKAHTITSIAKTNSPAKPLKMQLEDIYYQISSFLMFSKTRTIALWLYYKI